MPFSATDETPGDRAALELLGGTARRARLAHHWTQLELEDRTLVDQSTISLFERGLFPGMRIAWFVRLATTLGLDIPALAPADRFVEDAVLDALNRAREEAEGKRCPTCHHLMNRA
jgi:transcriptional regulator with XRE-family HTH domain